MSEPNEKPTDDFVSKAVAEARRDKIYTESVGPQTKPFPEAETPPLQPVDLKGQGAVRQSPVEIAIEDAVKSAALPEPTPAAKRFRDIAKSASNPKPQGT